MSSAHNKYIRERIALLEIERKGLPRNSPEYRKITTGIEMLSLELSPEPRRRRKPRLLGAIVVTLIGGILVSFLAFHFGVSR